MVRIGCICWCVSRNFGAWWLHMIMVVIEGSSLVAILAQWIASMVDPSILRILLVRMS